MAAIATLLIIRELMTFPVLNCKWGGPPSLRDTGVEPQFGNVAPAVGARIAGDAELKPGTITVIASRALRAPAENPKVSAWHTV
jgi:hypothetical protein